MGFEKSITIADVILGQHVNDFMLTAIQREIGLWSYKIRSAKLG